MSADKMPSAHLTDLRERAEEAQRHPYRWVDTAPSPAEVLALVAVNESDQDLVRAVGAFVVLIRDRGLGRFMPDELPLLNAMARLVADKKPAADGEA